MLNGQSQRTLALCGLMTLLTLPLAACQGPTTVIGRTSPVSAGTGASSPNAVATVGARPQVIIRFRTELLAAEVASFRATFGLRNVGTIPELGAYVEEVIADRPVEEILRDLRSSPMVLYAELNQQISLPRQ